MIEWLSWLPNESSFINLNTFEILEDNPNTPRSLKSLEQSFHELVGGSTELPPPPLLPDVVAGKRLRSGRVKNEANVESLSTGIALSKTSKLSSSLFALWEAVEL